MKQIYILFIIFLFSVVLNAQMNHKRKSRYGFEINSRPPIHYNVFISYINQAKLLLKLNVQNDILQFQKTGNHYSGKYEVSLNLKNSEDKQTLLSDTWSENVLVTEFEETNSKRKYQESTKELALDIPPGNYELYLEVRDAATGNVFYSTRTIGVENVDRSEISHSKPVLLTTKENYQNHLSISAFKNIIEFNQTPVIYFQIKTPDSDSINITSQIFSMQENEMSLPGKKQYQFYATDDYFQFAEELDKSYLTEGQYRLEYQVQYHNAVSTIRDTFEVIWFNKPIYLYEYDLALRPMKYLLSVAEFEKADSMSKEELKSWFLSYWKKKDPTPDTPFNELQYEFYYRVQKAIAEYSLRFKEGWNTNRGEAIIVYGEPSQIEKHHHGVKAKPFEIWHYKDLNKKLIFVDTKKNGDFNLVSIEQIEEKK